MVCGKWFGSQSGQFGGNVGVNSSARQGVLFFKNRECSRLICKGRQSDQTTRVTLDANLNFNAQLKNVCRTSYFHIRALRHIPSSIIENMANSVACALIQSRLNYANALYAGMSSTNFDKVQRVQNTFARVVTLTAKRDKITPTFERLHWLPIRYRVDYKLARLTYKIHLSGEPSHLRSQLVDYTPVRSLRSLVVPRTKLACVSRAFSVAALQLWNSLLFEVRDAEILTTFSKHLKAHLYRLAYKQYTHFYRAYDSILPVDILAR